MERNETVFPEFLVEAFSSESSDLDQNGVVSLREVFQYASEHTARWYEDSGHLATEHPLLDDNGDKRGSRIVELTENNEGVNAGALYLMDADMLIQEALADSGDEILAALFEEQLAVNRQISQLKTEKSNYSETDYLSKLEPLLIRLAEIAGEIEARQDEP
jgi:hypothetical protein